MLLVILIVLIGLAARLDAAPSDESIALARRYANILTGEDPDDDDSADTADDDEADGILNGGEGADGDGGADGDDELRSGARTDRDDEMRTGARADRDDETRTGARADGDDALGSGAWADRDGEVRSAWPDRDDELGTGARADDAGGEMRSSGAAAAGLPGALALLDAEQAPPDIATGLDASAAAATAGAAEGYEAWIRRHRPSLWGRVDLGVAWRQHWSQPRYAPARRSDEIWLFATWRR